MLTQQITVLGATGSVGHSTLDVIARHPERYRLHALTADSNVNLLCDQVLRYRPQVAVLRDANSARRLERDLRRAGCSVEVLAGDEGLAAVASDPRVDTVMAAIVGAAGLAPTLAAVRAGKRVLLANKESLVMAGALFMQAVSASGATLLPIDSEHNAIFQCLPPGYRCGEAPAGLRRILLTGSGGPLRTLPLSALDGVTPEQACAHPNWSMGPKISVDSATMMNKGLELIEACWLFGVEPARVEVVIHPQSVIHSMVEYVDGSVLAQLGHPDMRTPIAHALAWPERIEAGVPALDLIARGRLDFEAPDEQRFPCLRLARQAFLAGGLVTTALNAANEVAVAAFLEGRLRFSEIPAIIDAVLGDAASAEPATLEMVQDADLSARRHAGALVHGRS